VRGGDWVVRRGKGGEGDQREEGGEVGPTRRAEAVASLGAGERRRVRKTGCFGDGGEEMMGSSGPGGTIYIPIGGPSAPDGDRRPGARRRRHNGSASPAGPAPVHVPPPVLPLAQPPSLPNMSGEITVDSRGTDRTSDSASGRPTEHHRIEDQRTPLRRTCTHVPPGARVGACHPPHALLSAVAPAGTEAARLALRRHARHSRSRVPRLARAPPPQHVTRQRAVAKYAVWPADHSTSSRGLRAVAAPIQSRRPRAAGRHADHYACEGRPRAQRGPATGRAGGRQAGAYGRHAGVAAGGGRRTPARHAREPRQGAEAGRPSPDFHDVPAQPGCPSRAGATRLAGPAMVDRPDRGPPTGLKRAVGPHRDLPPPCQRVQQHVSGGAGL